MGVNESVDRGFPSSWRLSVYTTESGWIVVDYRESIEFNAQHPIRSFLLRSHYYYANQLKLEICIDSFTLSLISSILDLHNLLGVLCLLLSCAL